MQRPSRRFIGLALAGIAAIVLAGAVGGVIAHKASDRQDSGRWEHAADRGGPPWARDGKGHGPWGRGRGDGPPGMGGGMGGGPGMRGGHGMRGGKDGPGFGGPRHRLIAIALRDHLGVTEAELEEAMLKAVDDLVEDGDISADQAERMKERISNADGFLDAADKGSGDEGGDAEGGGAADGA